MSYREQMVAFTWEQLMKRHITESLRILYKRFCTEEDMTPERMEAMRDVCFAYKVTTKVPNMNCVLVIEKDGVIRQRVPYDEDEGAIIFLYDKESRIVWESLEGRHYTDSIVYETKRLFYEPRFVEMCRKYAASFGVWEQEDEREKPTFDNLKVNGIDAYDEREVFRLCSRRIREDNYEEDEFLSYLCFKLFQKEQYDKVTLMYLASYYCGATRDMKKLWKVLQEYEIPSYKIGERIITQMLFSENLFQEESVFEDYYLSDSVYFRLKQAYLGYVSREYVVGDRMLKPVVFEIIARECAQKEDLPDICKAALLKYYAGKQYPEELDEILHCVLREMCEKQLVFPFYLAYQEEWLREAQLYDKTMIFYHAKPGSRVKLYYKMRQENREELGYREESMMPMYENLYVKQFVLFADETVSYYFQEKSDTEMTVTEKETISGDGDTAKAGRYGKLNSMTQMRPATRRQAMMTYEEEQRLADQLFQMY